MTAQYTNDDGHELSIEAAPFGLTIRLGNESWTVTGSSNNVSEGERAVQQLAKDLEAWAADMRAQRTERRTQRLP